MTRKILDQLASEPMSRRQINRLLAGTGLSLAVMPVIPRACRAADQAVYFTWSGYDDPAFFPGYVSKHGSMPDTPIFADEEEAFLKLRGGSVVDVSHPCNNSIPRWRDAGLLAPIDTSRLSNWPDVFDELKHFEGAEDGDKQYFVPVDWGNTSIVYRTDLVDISEESWTLLWDERYAGKLSVSKRGRRNHSDCGPPGRRCGSVQSDRRRAGEGQGTAGKAEAADPLLLGHQHNDRARPRLRRTRGDDGLEQLGGDVLKAQGVPVKFMNPKEGIFTYCCGLVLAKDAPHVDAAYDLIDAMIAHRRRQVADRGAGLRPLQPQVVRSRRCGDPGRARAAEGSE